MEELVERYKRDNVLMDNPLFKNQFVYQAGKSTELALLNAVTFIENAVEHKEITLGEFLDIEEAFDRTSFKAIDKAAEQHRTKPTICRWISSMLESRNNMTAIQKVYAIILFLYNLFILNV
jgi:hypothetical protein